MFIGVHSAPFPAGPFNVQLQAQSATMALLFNNASVGGQDIKPYESAKQVPAQLPHASLPKSSK